MENKKRKVKLLEASIVMSIWAKGLEDFFTRTCRFRKKEEVPLDPVRPNEVVLENDEEPNFYFEEEPKDEVPSIYYWDLLSEEVRNELIAKTGEVKVLFSDKRFLMTFFYENHEFLVKVLESLYYEGKLNCDLLKQLLASGQVKLTEEDIAYFKEIGLIQIQNSNGGNGSSLT